MAHRGMSLIRTAPLWVVLCALPLAACAPELNWREVRPANAQALQAVFPCKPDVAERRIALAGLAEPVTLHLLSCQADGAMWALSHFTVSDVAQVPAALRALAAATRGNVEAAAQQGAGALPGRPDFRAVELAPVAVPRMTPQPDARAWRFETSSPGAEPTQRVPLAVTAWHFSHGLAVFQAAVWQRGEAVTAQPSVYSGRDAANTFFQGFHFPG